LKRFKGTLKNRYSQKMALRLLTSLQYSQPNRPGEWETHQKKIGDKQKYPVQKTKTI